MYRNPEVFKVNTIVQTIERLKRGSSDPDEADADGDLANQPVVLNKLSQAEPPTEAKCKEVAMETISRTVDVIKPSYPGSTVRTNSHRHTLQSLRNVTDSMVVTHKDTGWTDDGQQTHKDTGWRADRHQGGKRAQIPEGLSSKVSLAESTKGLYFQKVRSRKVMGGIFAVIKLKKQIDEFERLQSKQPTAN